jgi:aromatic ring hydroxylase
MIMQCVMRWAVNMDSMYGIAQLGILSIGIRKIASIQEDILHAFMMTVVYSCIYKCLL